MDPLSALAIAAAAVQFVALGFKIVSRLSQPDQAKTRANVEIDDLSEDCIHLTVLVKEVQQASKSLGNPRPGSASERLQALCRECEKLLGDVEEAVGASATTSQQSKRESKFGNFRRAAIGSKRPCTRDELKVLKSRMNGLEHDMIMPTLVCLWEESLKQNTDIEGLLAQQMELLELAKKPAAGVFFDELGSIEYSKARHKLAVEVVRSGFIGPADEGQLSACIAGTDSGQTQKAILASLDYVHSNARREAIPKAYQRTYDWIFKEPGAYEIDASWHSFPEWLKQETDQVYWITGKPGSGKSTLMKHIVESNDDQLQKQLAMLSGPKTIVASFYSWVAGTDLQKTRDGMLRNLLGQIFEREPGLARASCPERWAISDILGKDIEMPTWSPVELATTFDWITTKASGYYRFLFFIDGLDEFQDSHKDLVTFVKSLGARPGVKVCTSSRPWNDFYYPFHKGPSLQMQSLTRLDVEWFVRSTFEGENGFNQLSRIYPSEAKDLVGSVVDKAHGVFLWVTVVVEKLVDKIINGATLQSLLDTVELLPAEIEGLFNAIWGGVGPEYQTDGVCLFRLFESRVQPLHAAKLWLADENVSLDYNMETFAIEEVIDTTRRRLASRTKGLLEVSSSGYVEYLHRTVLEWAGLNALERFGTLPPSYDTSLRLLKAEVNCLKIADQFLDIFQKPSETILDDKDRMEEYHERRKETFARYREKFWYWPEVEVVLLYAMNVMDTPDSLAQSVEVLDRADLRLRKLSQSGKLPSWTIDSCPARHRSDFYKLAAQFDLGYYVRANIQNIPLSVDLPPGAMSILECSIFGWDHFRASEAMRLALAKQNPHSEKRMDLVKYLLAAGAKVDQPCHDGWKIAQRLELCVLPDQYILDTMKLVKKQKWGRWFRKGSIGAIPNWASVRHGGA